MNIYQMNCVDMVISENEITFSADPMSLDQDCDMVELYKTNYLQFFYNNGSEFSAYAPAFKSLYVDSQNERVDIYVSKQYLETNCSKNNFTMISIKLKNSELLTRLAKTLPFDKMISLEDWLQIV